MQQVGNLSQSQDYDYSRLVGDNGPMVYPAGHAWLYSGLHHVTGGGANTRLAQYLAIGVYILNLALVFRLLLRTERMPPYLLALVSLAATRVRSLTVLHLFNDPIAILFLHAAINMFLDGRWSLGSVLFSLGVSIKMNVLLYAPALLCIYLVFLGIYGTIIQLSICASVQLLLALPFLFADPLAYMSAAFNLNRSFLHRDSVNFSFVPRAIFTSKVFHLTLLCCHLGALLYSTWHWWTPLQQVATWTRRSNRMNNTNNTKDDTNNNNAKPILSSSDKSGHLDIHWTSRWRTQVVLVSGVVVVMCLTSLPPFHPVLVHGLFWPTLAIVFTFPAILLGNFVNIQVFESQKEERQISEAAQNVDKFIFPLFFSNFIGIVCSRSVHIQFYSWYFYSLPYLVWKTSFSAKFKLLLLR